MKYIVSVGYKRFSFDNVEEATLFAEMAVEHRGPEDRDIDVSIKVVDE